MIITKQMTENDILRTNLQYYWNNFSESEQKWLISHIVLEQDKTLIYKDDSWRDWKDFIDRLSRIVLYKTDMPFTPRHIWHFLFLR